jgi:hypothetical protein
VRERKSITPAAGEAVMAGIAPDCAPAIKVLYDVIASARPASNRQITAVLLLPEITTGDTTIQALGIEALNDLL